MGALGSANARKASAIPTTAASGSLVGELSVSSLEAWVRLEGQRGETKPPDLSGTQNGTITLVL